MNGWADKAAFPWEVNRFYKVLNGSLIPHLKEPVGDKEEGWGRLTVGGEERAFGSEKE
jgi:hypothetical protein